MSQGALLLDTNVLVAILRGRTPVVRERLGRARAAGQSITVSALSMFELWHGVARSDRPAVSAQQVRELLDGGVDVIAFGNDDAEVAGALRLHLDRAGTPIGPYDLLIAAQAVRTGRTVITANVREFSRVPDLTWENWSAPEGDAGQ